MKRRRLHITTFICAAIYNAGWGLLSSINPQWLFEFAGMELMRHPQVFACLGMVVGVYAIVYAEIARRPEFGVLLACVGLIGKILGPIGWLYLYFTGVWPLETIVLIISNDLIWWIPFVIYLHDAWLYYKSTFKEQTPPNL